MHILEDEDWFPLCTPAARPSCNRPDEQLAYLPRIADCTQRRLNRQFDLCRVGNLQEILRIPKEYLLPVLHQQYLVGF